MSQYINPKLAAMEAYIPGEQPQDKRYIKLNTNESPYPPSKGVKKAVDESGIYGILGGAFSAASIGCTVSLITGYLAAVEVELCGFGICHLAGRHVDTTANIAGIVRDLAAIHIEDTAAVGSVAGTQIYCTAQTFFCFGPVAGDGTAVEIHGTAGLHIDRTAEGAVAAGQFAGACAIGNGHFALSLDQEQTIIFCCGYGLAV